MMLKKANEKPSPPGQKNLPMQQDRLGAAWLESSFPKKHLGVLMDNQLNTCQQCALQ